MKTIEEQKLTIKDAIPEDQLNGEVKTEIEKILKNGKISKKEKILFMKQINIYTISSNMKQ